MGKKILIDTNILIDMSNEKIDISNEIQSYEEIYTTTINIFEFCNGKDIDMTFYNNYFEYFTKLYFII